jgi:maltose/moltooligosaccharide transporter
MLAKVGVSNVGTGTGETAIPDTVRYSFDIGAVVLAGAMLWTIFRTREYPPAELHGFADATPLTEGVEPGSAARARARGLAWLARGALGAFLVGRFALDPQLYVRCGGLAVWGAAQMLPTARDGMFATLMRDIDNMPQRMRQLVPVQFFSWLALFAMWIYTTAAVTQSHFGATDATSAAYNDGANWVGVLFAGYNGFAALAAIVIPMMVRRLGINLSHLVNLLLGGLGLASFVLIREPKFLMVSMVGVGFAWASILSLPYALLAGSVPSRKMGVYMGIFNFFIVIPQLVAASVLGAVLNGLLGGQPVNALLIGGASFVLAGLLALRVK